MHLQPGAQPPLWKNPALWQILALSTLPILPYNWLPVLFNIFEREFGANMAQQGRTVQYLFASGLLVVVSGGWLTKKLGIGRASFCAILTCATGLLLTGTSVSFASLLAGCSVYGFGITWMYVIYGVLVSRFFPGQYQKVFLLNNMVLSLIAGIGPALLGRWISVGLVWRHAFLWVAALNVILGFLILRLKEPPPAAAKAVQPAQIPNRGELPVLFSWTMWLIGIVYILHGIAEIGAISWAGKLYHLRLGIPEEEMGLFVSANVISFAIGRFLLSFIAGRFKDLSLLAICGAGGTVFFVLILMTSQYTAGLFFMAGSGIFMSGNAPAVNSYIAHHFSNRIESAFAIAQGFGALGSAIAPALIGFAGDRAGLEKAFWLIPLSSGALALLALVWGLAQSRSRAAVQG